MIENCRFYLTHTVENSHRIDQWANSFLAPLHRRLNLHESTKVKAFHVDLAKQEVKTRSAPEPIDFSILDDESLYTPVQKFLIKGMIKVMEATDAVFDIIFIIPFTFLGCIFKAIALVDSELRTQYQLIFQKINPPPLPPKLLPKPFASVQDTPINTLMPTSSSDLSQILPTDIVLKIISQLPPQEIIKLEQINRSWYTLVRAPTTNVIIDYRKNLPESLNVRGLPQPSENASFHSFSIQCKTYVDTHHYSHPDILDLFGNLETLLSLRTIDLKGEKIGYQELEQFTHHDTFSRCPSLFRLRLNWNGTGITEFIIIKYTLFIPKEEKMWGKEVDEIWHDYLFLRYRSYKDYSFHDKQGHWAAQDPRSHTALPTDLRAKANYLGFPGHVLWSYPAICTPDSLADSDSIARKQIKKLVNGQLAGFFDDKKYSRRPNYLQDRTVQGHPHKRMFKDIPISLGHVSVEDISKHFKTKVIPDYIEGPNGTRIKNLQKKEGDLSQMMVFDE